MHETEITLSAFGLNDLNDGNLEVRSPVDGELLARLDKCSGDDVAEAVDIAQKAFRKWRKVPAPKRGELVRLLGEELRKEKENLGRLVTLECGKIFAEGLGEVQEMIDICDFAVGISRQLYGLTIASERPGHHMREVWQPLGPIGLITAFNFPVAVWSWNTALAIVCGDPVIWKPSNKTPLTALACAEILNRACRRFRDGGNEVPDNLVQVMVGRRDIGEAMCKHKGIPLISATGSVPMGQAVAEMVASRLGRSLLELGGNNGMIVAPSADLKMAASAILFGAVGTAGQRCTTLRRLIVHEDIKDKLLDTLKDVYEKVRVGNPLDPDTLVGPLIDKKALDDMQRALKESEKQGGKIIVGGDPVSIRGLENGAYVRPAIVEMPSQSEVVHKETFAPILYAMTYRDLDSAIEMHNEVPQGLSSCIFTTDVRESELFLSATGSDCGIANVNIGPSGAEIGGAFGGEKETGGGRESGSDAWKAYMRRQTQTINYSQELPLAQGIVFNV
jgi:aldehyde dehydrogenase (NAD+)